MVRHLSTLRVVPGFILMHGQTVRQAARQVVLLQAHIALLLLIIQRVQKHFLLALADPEDNQILQGQLMELPEPV